MVMSRGWKNTDGQGGCWNGFLPTKEGKGDPEDYGEE